MLSTCGLEEIDIEGNEVGHQEYHLRGLYRRQDGDVVDESEYQRLKLSRRRLQSEKRMDGINDVCGGWQLAI